MVRPPPKRPTGGTAVLLLLVLAVLFAVLLIWAWSAVNPSRPTPAGTARPKVLPPTTTGGARPLH